MTKQTAPDPIARSTRDDWLRVALDALVSDGVDAVKVFSLSERLGVSRSSFYWYFRDRKDLLDALVTHWEDTNTAPFLRAASANAPTITASILGVFRLFIDPDLFDPRLDFAMRGWALGDGSVRRALDT
ncbi:MAG: TetR/AcrR family transcriptional regulator, partial [Pseudomonadota bacterium]